MAASLPGEDAPLPPAPLRRAAASASSLAGVAAPPLHHLDSSASPSPPSTSSDPDDSPKAGRWVGLGAGREGGAGKGGHAKESAPFLPGSANGRAAPRARGGTTRRRPSSTSTTARRIAATFGCVLAAAAIIAVAISRPWLVAGWALREGGPVLVAGVDWSGRGGGGVAAATSAPPPAAAASPSGAPLAPLPPPPPPLSRIPRIVHQTWRGPASSLPPAWAAARARCAALHPGWTFKLWSDADARALVARAAPGLLATYDAYPDAIQRADVMRYVALWAEGGVYLDLDVECVRPMDGLLTPPAALPPATPSGEKTTTTRHSTPPPSPRRPPSAILPITWPVSLSNDVMAAEPGSPLMAALIAAAPGAAAATRHWPRYARVMFSTGPMLVTAVATGRGGRAANAVLEAAASPSSSPVFGVLPPGLYGKYGAHGVRLGGGGEESVDGGGEKTSSSSSTAPLFTHLHGSSWHGADAGAAIWAAHHGWALGAWGTALGLSLLSAGAVVAVRSSRAAAAAASAAAAAAAGGEKKRSSSHRRRPSSAHRLYSEVPAPELHPALDAAAKMC